MTLGVGFGSVELGGAKAKVQTRLLVLKDGDIGWAGIEGVTLDQEQADVIIAAFELQKVQLPIDYEHATPDVEKGKRAKAPAAGWIKGLVYVKGEGLYADPVEWTDEAKAEIEKKQYKYFSPVIVYDQETLAIKKLHSAALTNKPRTIGQSELLAAAQLITDILKGNAMPKTKGKRTLTVTSDTGVIALLSAQEDMDDLPAMTADQAAIGKLLAVVNDNGAGLGDEATLAQVLQAAIDIIGGGASEPEGEPESEEASLKEIAARLGAEDGKTATILAKIDNMRATTVPGKQYEDLKGRIKGLETEKQERLVTAKVAEYVECGKLNPNDADQMKWAREACGRNLEDFDSLMARAPKVWEPGTTTVGNSGGTKTGRAGKIATHAKEWENNQDHSSIRGTQKWAHVNACLGIEGDDPLSKDERKALA